MTQQDSAVLRDAWRRWYKPTLDHLFKEFESAGVRLTPDAAIEEMVDAFKSALDRSESPDSSKPTNSPASRPLFRFDDVALTREAHHYAVDLYYRYYFPRMSVPMGGGRTLWRWNDADIAKGRKVADAQKPGPKGPRKRKRT